MGLSKEGLHLIAIGLESITEPQGQMSMFELGNQRPVGKLQQWGFATTKEYFESRNVRHVSLDLNGLDGALPRSICDPLDDLGEFDIVTNYGSSEHVECQKQCFTNLHSLCKVGGVMVHHVPEVGSWPGHCPHYYTQEFFKQLAEQCGYELLHLGLDNVPNRGNLVECVYRKANPHFTASDDLFTKHIHFVPTPQKTGDYSASMPDQPVYVDLPEAS